MNRLVPTIAAALLVTACGDGDGARPNVLVIVVDTLRADRLGCYGAERETSPNLDRLAADGARFERAYAPSPWTRPSVATILTGLYPSGHGVIGTSHLIGKGTPTLAGILKAEGYATAAVNSNKIVSRGAYGHGFDQWDQGEAKGPKHLTAPGVTRRAQRLIKKMVRTDEPFFLYVHYMDPHVNYLAHDELDFVNGPVGRLKGGEGWNVLHDMRTELTEDELAFLHDLYDGEIRITDEGIGELLQTLRDLGEYENTIVVMTSDHGEELMDHGFIGHTRSLYEELLHVPFLIKPSGSAPDTDAVSPGHVVSEPVTLVSLVPTVLGLAGCRLPPGLFQAPSLLEQVHGGPGRSAPIFCEVDFVPPEKASVPVPEVHKRSLRLDGYKLIVDGRTNVLELYDLSEDPGEHRNLTLEEPERVRRLLAELQAAHERSGQTAYTAEEKEHTAEELEALRKLGYAE